MQQILHVMDQTQQKNPITRTNKQRKVLVAREYSTVFLVYSSVLIWSPKLSVFQHGYSLQLYQSLTECLMTWLVWSSKKIEGTWND